MACFWLFSRWHDLSAVCGPTHNGLSCKHVTVFKQYLAVFWSCEGSPGASYCSSHSSSNSEATWSSGRSHPWLLQVCKGMQCSRGHQGSSWQRQPQAGLSANHTWDSWRVKLHTAATRK